tara:strand:+ start:100 stop:336 length:237 start_codon:yes stop_codon:yes gene_type:complete
MLVEEEQESQILEVLMHQLVMEVRGLIQLLQVLHLQVVAEVVIIQAELVELVDLVVQEAEPDLDLQVLLQVEQEIHLQ